MIAAVLVVLLGGWFVLRLFGGVGGLGTQVNQGVAYWAHVGGFLFGVVTALLLFRGQRRRPRIDAGMAPPDLLGMG